MQLLRATCSFGLVLDGDPVLVCIPAIATKRILPDLDRKSTRLNSSHVSSSYAVFCLKKKKEIEAVVDRADDESAEDSGPGGTEPAEYGGSADDVGSDQVEQILGADQGGSGMRSVSGL